MADPSLPLKPWHHLWMTPKTWRGTKNDSIWTEITCNQDLTQSAVKFRLSFYILWQYPGSKIHKIFGNSIFRKNYNLISGFSCCFLYKQRKRRESNEWNNLSPKNWTFIGSKLYILYKIYYSIYAIETNELYILKVFFKIIGIFRWKWGKMVEIPIIPWNFNWIWASKNIFGQ